MTARLLAVVLLCAPAAWSQRYFAYVGSLGPDFALIAWGTASGVNTIGRSSPSHGKAVVKVGGGAVAVSDRNWAVIRGLQPDTEYPYEVELNGRTIATSRLRTWPVKSDKLCFFVIGDWGSGDQWQYRVASAMWDEFGRREKTDCPVRFVLTTGDNLYGQFGLTLKFRNTGDTDDQWGPKFLVPYRELIARVPFFPSLGNHDGNETEARGDLTAYLDNFFFPGLEPARYYRFSYGGLADFFALDSTLNTETGPPKAIFEKDGDQHKWLTKNLSETRVPWKIPYMHHPPFNAGPRHEPVAKSLSHFLDAFKENGVRVVFSGHEHNFQFSEANRTTGGIRYIVSGAGGELRESNVRALMKDAQIEGWAAQYHFLMVEIYDKEMKVTPVSFQPVTVVDASNKKIEMPLKISSE